METKKSVSFSGYSKALVQVFEIIELNDNQELTLSLLNKFKSKIKNMILAIDGVYAQILKIKNANDINFEIVVKINKNSFSNSSLVEILSGDFVNISTFSSNKNKFLLNVTTSIIFFNNVSNIENHQYTQKFTFRCSKDVFERIINENNDDKERVRYVEINGSALFIQNHYNNDDCYYFSIHAGRKTRETTIFGQKYFKTNKKFTLTFPYIEPGLSQ